MSTSDAPTPTAESISYKTIAAVGSLVGIILALGGVVWFQSAQAAQVEANAAAIQKLECMPERLVRVETKVDAILTEI